MLNQSNLLNTPTPPPQAPTKSVISNGSASAASEPSLGRTPLGSSPASPDQATVIGKSLVIKGEITGSELIYIDGKVDGSISLAGNRLTVGRNGQVSANITAGEIVVQGKIYGNIEASDRLEVRSEGVVTGDVVALRISIEEGAVLNGKIEIRRPGQPETEEPAINAEQPVEVV